MSIIDEANIVPGKDMQLKKKKKTEIVGGEQDS